MTTKTNTNPWLMDSRVRERNLKSGALTEKDLEKHLAALPDLEGQYDAVITPQPALEQPRVAAASIDEGDDESDSDLGDESSDDVGGDDDADDDDGATEGGGGEGGAGPGAVEGGDSEPTEGGGEA